MLGEEKCGVGWEESAMLLSLNCVGQGERRVRTRDKGMRLKKTLGGVHTKA